MTEIQGSADVPALTPGDILEFWYSEPMASRWFSSSPQLDAEIRASYEQVWRAALEGRLDDWKSSPEGCLALVIVLDQLPLNMFRGEASSFSTEQQAVEVCKLAIARGYDRTIDPGRLGFLYMPLMHSENLADQDLSVKMFEQAGLEGNLRFARHHRELIRKFGRFPHRNAVLGRESSREELEYLGSKEAFLG
ncbi:MAG: DUF924 family protein [Sulfurimicrobium sp.]|nr:DUF924 family protein [Sulfurimicrobium sp.]MDP1705000.1 DUF924 family protein [Sulfurimicrobium sp.]MDP3688734.1 DUF924 family protein [Sulfurimicrobium sp.]